MLVRDLLVMRNHTGIRIMDGPGDGCRDIHSHTPESYLHITQVAHVRQPTKTIGTRKVGELPNALLKFGASHGLIVTSGRISPQAKRECLNDYQQFDLDFLDGDALADEILRQVPLKAIWFDGAEFGRVSNCIRVPVLLRDPSAGNHWFLHVQILEENGAPLLSTAERLRSFAATLAVQAERFEQQLKGRGVDAERATRQYWNEVCWLDFRVTT